MAGPPLSTLPDHLDDAALVERVRRGDASAYDTLVRRHEEPCFRTAYRITGDAEEARDAAQDAFVKAYVNLDRFRAGAPFRPWIVRIAANEARNRRVAAARRRGLAERAAGASGAAGAGGRSSPAGGVPAAPAAAGVPDAGAAVAAPSPESAVLAQERRDAIVAALNELRRDDRVAIASRYFLELSEAEMVATLGWAPGTVKSRLSRALRRLRPRLLAAGVLTLVVSLALLGVPQARTAIAERLGLLGVRILRVPALPVLPTQTASPPGAPTPADALAALGADLRLGQQVSLAEAQRRVSYRIRLPTAPVPGTPDGVFHNGAVAGGQVAFVYRPYRAAQGDVTLLVVQFRGALEPDLFVKMLGPGTRLERLSVAGHPAVWMEGAPHAVVVRTPDGQIVADQTRLAANVLAWEGDGLTLRLEGAIDRDTALRLAAAFS